MTGLLIFRESESGFLLRPWSRSWSLRSRFLWGLNSFEELTPFKGTFSQICLKQVIKYLHSNEKSAKLRFYQLLCKPHLQGNWLLKRSWFPKWRSWSQDSCDLRSKNQEFWSQESIPDWSPVITIVNTLRFGNWSRGRRPRRRGWTGWRPPP